MALTINDNGEWTATDDHCVLICQMQDTIRHHKGATRDILLGILYDEWHVRFDEEVPQAIMKTVEYMKRATCN